MNADACRRAGAALSLTPEQVSAEAVHAAVSRMLTEPGCSAAARGVAAEIAAMPDADTAVATLLDG